jgi:cellulose biosynthesis protein BcsQ
MEMRPTVVAFFFSDKRGIRKKTLVYHTAWMVSDLGIRVVTADLDPQANLSAAFLDEDRLEELWPEGDHPNTVYGCIQPLLRGIGDIADPHLEIVEDQLALLVGDLALSGFEDELSGEWPGCMDGKERSFCEILDLHYDVGDANGKNGLRRTL